MSTFLIFFILFDLAFIVIVTIGVFVLCYFTLNRRKIRKYLSDIVVTVNGRVTGVEFMEKGMFDKSPTLLDSLMTGEPNEKVHVYSIQIEDTQDYIKGQALNVLTKKLSPKDYAVAKKISNFHGICSDTPVDVVYVQINEEQYKAFNGEFDVTIDICPLKDATTALISTHTHGTTISSPRSNTRESDDKGKEPNI